MHAIQIKIKLIVSEKLYVGKNIIRKSVAFSI
jgi:hypothetical protein